MKNLTKIGGVLIVFVALAALVGSTFTFAQDSDTADFATEAQAGEGRPFGHRGGGPRGHLDQIIDREAVKEAVETTLGLTFEEVKAMHDEGMTMADILEAQGVTQEEIETAVLNVITEAVETAVNDGTITEAQGAQILERASQFEFGKRGHRGQGRGMAHEIFGDLDMKAIIADALGITVDELAAYHANGMRLPEIAAELGVELDSVETAVRTAVEAALADAVEAGTITQEQADQLLNGGGRGFGPRGGKGFGGHGFNHGDRGFQQSPVSNGQDA